VAVVKGINMSGIVQHTVPAINVVILLGFKVKFMIY